MLILTARGSISVVIILSTKVDPQAVRVNVQLIMCNSPGIDIMLGHCLAIFSS